MTKTQHTPGPWKPHRIKYHFSGTSDLFRIHWTDDGDCVAEIVHGEANARLIAAAPDLLEALEELAQVALLLQPTCFGDEGTKAHAIEDAYTAIAKARGETELAA